LNVRASSSRVLPTKRLDALTWRGREMLGLDPLYVANEGVLVAFVEEGAAPRALEALRAHPLGTRAAIAGRAVAENAGLVVLRTRIGSRRVVDMLPGDQLPRIC
jgi:hydrogenase expression/formation protein HypE